LKRNNLVIYLIITFSITWISWWLLAGLTQFGTTIYGDTLFMILFMVGGLGPTVAPFITNGIIEGKEGLKQFNKVAFKWRLPVYWYFLAITILFVPRFAAIGIGSLFDLQFSVSYQSWLQFFPTFLLMIIGGGLEEFGWRGLALPELLKKFDTFKSTIILGLIWSLWHLPLFFLNFF